MTTANLTKVIVPCRLSYAHLWEPDSINGSEPKYSVSCIIDKNDKETIAKIKKAIEVAKDEGKGKWGGKIPANLKSLSVPEPMRRMNSRQWMRRTISSHRNKAAEHRKGGGIHRPDT